MIAATEDDIDEHVAPSVLSGIKEKLVVTDLINQLGHSGWIKGAFISLLVVELIFLLQIVPGSSELMLPMPIRMLPYTFLLVILALFGVGVLRVER